jgi:HD-like signal output (HDOD) protein
VQSSTTKSTLPAVQTLLERLPPLSPTLTLLLATLARENVSYAKISDLIEQDPVLAGNVLGLVNSSLFGRREKVNSVRYAVSLLGVSRLRNAALSMSITRMWNKMHSPASWSMKNFNRHSLAVAMLVDVLSQEAPIDNPEGAFVAGLLHDLGKLMVAVCLTGEYTAIEEQIVQMARPPLECEAEILGATHAELSGEAMRAWGMPGPIEAAVRYHHTPELDPARPNQNRFSLSYAVATADEYVNQLNWGKVGYAPVNDKPAVYPLEALGLDDVQRVLDLFHEEFESAKAFF